jgi:formylglycine-generating enzyme
MVLIAQCYCIDSTEVTRDQYAAWLDRNPPDTGQLPECSWNTGVDAFKPICEWPPGTKGQHPVVCVDWCDAYAYCKGAGKRLCGQIGAGANDYGDDADATKSQWYNACSSGGKNIYPYGSTYQPQTCNGSNHGVGTTVAVGSMSGCGSTLPGYTGAYDLSGNAFEWQDSCDGATGSNDLCRLGGGAFNYDSYGLQCFVGSDGSCSYRNYAYDFFGFRCCAP